MGTDRLERTYEFCVLATRSRELQMPLSASQQARLRQLTGELGDTVPQLDEDDARTQLSSPWRASFALSGRFGAGWVRNASGAGVAIETTQAPSAGERVLLELRCPGSHIEYTFPGYVVWRVVAGTPSFGVRFQGVPSATRPNGRRSSGIYPADPSLFHDGDQRRAS